MMRDITTRGKPQQLHLVYGSKDSNDIILRDKLDELARSHDTIDVTLVISAPDPAWDGRTGFITGDLIAELAGPHLNRTTYYLCGPPPMYDFCLNALEVRISGVFVHPFRSNPYTRFGVFVHPA
jgi:NAD(P)H-flavin reductase